MKRTCSLIRWGVGLVLVVLAPVLIIAQQVPGRTTAPATVPRPVERNALLENALFINIPGPNPILRRGGPGAWDERLIEAGDAFADFGTYYLSYHARATENGPWPSGYQIGLATAAHPLGPWDKSGDKPLLGVGPTGSWDDEHVACPKIVRAGQDKYYLFYCGRKRSDPAGTWHVGLATASAPSGPWTKSGNKPVLDDFGYVGGVALVRGQYFLYVAHPVNSTSPDYGFMKVATAAAPEGPWTKSPHNPVLVPGDWGSWDDGGFSESEVEYWNGVFHAFYDGATYHSKAGRRTAIGYAYSFDGYNFTKYGRNPVASTQLPANVNLWESKEMPEGARMMAETHTLIEPPFIYLYSTIRPHESNPIGVQVLATERPFRLDMPVLTLPSLGPKTRSGLDSSSPLSLSNIGQLALTVECTYAASAKNGIRIHVRSSYDGMNYDTTDLHAFELEVQPGRLVRKTVEIRAPVRFIRVDVENLDAAQSVANVKVRATLGS